MIALDIFWVAVREAAKEGPSLRPGERQVVAAHSNPILDEHGSPQVREMFARTGRHVWRGHDGWVKKHRQRKGIAYPPPRGL